MNAVFIITIDTEGDNIWSRPETITTENSRFLPRFQALCEKYGFKPVYLTSYEMAVDPRFQQFGREVLARGAGEIGLHVHAWNSPPLHGQKYDPRRDLIYLFELPDDLLAAKIDRLHTLLADTFGQAPVSHRAGRWGFDERVARMLVERGYTVDCSVTPGVSWRGSLGAPDGAGGSDYTGFPYHPYFMDLDDLSKPGDSPLLQVPMTIRPTPNPIAATLLPRIKGTAAQRAVERFFGGEHVWLRPNGRNLREMLALVERVLAEGAPVLEFMLHSCEFMPGGSPLFITEAEIERLYNHLEKLFQTIAGHGVPGMTLAEYRAVHQPNARPEITSLTMPEPD